MADNFRYLNLNPFQKKTGDCVIRATALGLGVDWHRASDMLYEQARGCGCEMSCLGCYSNLFKRLGFDKVNISDEEVTVGEIAKKHKYTTLIIRVQGHLTCAINSIVYDIWDCTNEIVDCFWEVA